MKRLLLTLLTAITYMSCLYGQDFVALPVPDSVWHRMQGKTYRDNPHIGRDDLRYLRLLHWDYDGQTRRGEMVCNRRIADKLVNIFRQLYEHHYPIQRMRLPDEYDADDERQMSDNNTSCFCYRTVPGSNRLSLHARGLAVDINTLYNPYVRRRKDGTLIVKPANGKPYTDRRRDFRYKITSGDLCHRLFLENGFTWGGAWRSLKDYQHFEYNCQLSTEETPHSTYCVFEHISSYRYAGL